MTGERGHLLYVLQRSRVKQLPAQDSNRVTPVPTVLVQAEDLTPRPRSTPPCEPYRSTSSLHGDKLGGLVEGSKIECAKKTLSACRKHMHDSCVCVLSKILIRKRLVQDFTTGGY